MKILHRFLTLFVIVAVLLPAAIPSYDVLAQGDLIEVEIQPDNVMKDTQIVSSTPTTNFYTATNFGVGESNSSALVSRSLLEFDLSGLPHDATIFSATLSLWVDVDQSDNARTMYAYPINSEWFESQATWNVRKTSTNWQTAGASGADDALSTDMGSVSLANNLTAGTRVDMVLDVDAVQAMLHQNYFGFKLQMDTETSDRYLFKSSDHATSAERPMLTIEYYPDTPIVDAGWLCIQGTISLQLWPTCDPSSTTTVPSSPFTKSASGLEASVTYGGSPNALGEEAIAVKLNCTPYPRCINDHPIHYRIVYDASWVAAGSTGGSLWATLIVPGGSNAQESVGCDSGVTGDCLGVFEGMIDTTDLPVNHDGTFNIGLIFGYTFPATWPITSNTLAWNLYLSQEPFDQDCADTYMVPVPYTYEIDPIIETPAGPVDDYQIFETEVDGLYMVRVENGPWDDGTDPRTDAAVSFDGSTWMTWEEFGTLALCIDTDETNRDFDVMYFIATGTEFHIRANDTAGNFGNNTNDAETPFQYVIGLALPIDEGECGSQFTFDDVDDLVAQAEVDSTDTDTTVLSTDEPPTAEFMQVGEWYAIEVVSGTWNEPAEAAQIAMQFDLGSTLLSANWQDLAEGSDMVACVVSTDRDIVFIQNNDPTGSLHLRVDDEDLNWANNTGTLNVNVYHAAYDRRSETCELNFALDDLVRSDSVLATQDNGKVFAFSVGTLFINNSEQEENFLSYGLVPGAWYALETTGGPWIFSSSPNNSLQGRSYDLEVAEEASASTGTTPEESWGPLDEWDMAECNVQTDQLGHRLIYFQIPATAANQWKLRVADDFGWPFKSGSMSWNLYRVIDLGVSYNGLCDYSYSVEDIVNEAPYTVNATASAGAPLVFEPDTYYAVEILGEDYEWAEDGVEDPQTAMQISLNNGQTWGDLPGTGALCSVEDGENLIFFIHTGQDQPYFRMRVDSASFNNNVGIMGWNVYVAEAGSSVDPWDGCVAAGYQSFAISPREQIPVAMEEGRMITASSGTWVEIGGLVPGNRYLVQTMGGPWYDSAEQVFENQSYDAEVSSDGGETWQPLNGTNTDISCWEVTQDLKHDKIEFIVEPGQVWKIRVADDADFTDNTGNLQFILRGETVPLDVAVQGHINIPGCNTPPIVPEALSVDDFLNVGNYLAGWLDYATASIIGFLAWCPEHTASLSLFGSDLSSKDPFATLDEVDALLNDIKNEIDGYDWNDDVEDYSILTKSPEESAEMIETYVFGPLPDDSPWLGNDLVNFDDAPAPTQYYDACQLSLKDYVGPLLGEGVCFASNWAREVGMSFWLQLALDVSIIFACIAAVLNDARRLLYLFTGVNLSIQGGDAKVFVNYIQPEDDNNRRGRR